MTPILELAEPMPRLTKSERSVQPLKLVHWSFDLLRGEQSVQRPNVVDSVPLLPLIG